MRRPLTVIVCLAAVSLVLTACGGSTTSGSTSQTTAATPATPAVSVSIRNKAFVPRVLTVHEGQPIVWHNDSNTAQTVTSDAGSAVDFDSGTLEPGGSWRGVSLGAGTYRYSSTLSGAVGTIRVRP